MTSGVNPNLFRVQHFIPRGGRRNFDPKGRSPMPKWPRAGSGVLGEGASEPSPHQLEGLGERWGRKWCKLRPQVTTEMPYNV